MVKFFRKIKRLIRELLAIVPYGEKILAYYGSILAYKTNFKKLKFQGLSLQDMMAYIYMQKKNFGFYIDIGANDGLNASNTYIFEQLGWKGVCIEPQPDVFKKLRRFRKCDCYNVALSSCSNESVDFFKADNSSLSGFYQNLHLINGRGG